MAKLGYDTARRTTLSPEAIGLSGETANAIKRVETLSEDPEVGNLPVAKFGDSGTDAHAIARFASAIDSRDFGAAFGIFDPMLEASPFSSSVMTAMGALVERIIAVERDRGNIARSESSALAHAAQPLQDLLDRMIFRMAGVTDGEAVALQKRLAQML